MGRKRRRKPRGPDLENCETFIVDGAYQNSRADPKVVPRNLNQKHYINILNDWNQVATIGVYILMMRGVYIYLLTNHLKKVRY